MKHSDSELKEFSEEHLYYEVLMLVAPLRLSCTQLTQDESQVLLNMQVESFAIHCRNLITFFYPTKTELPGDIYAKDFYSNPSDWNMVCPKITETMVNARSRANKEVGHITSFRVAGSSIEKVWDFRLLTIEIVEILKKFATTAKENTLSENFLKLVNHL